MSSPIRIGRRTMRVAHQSLMLGMGLSGVAMLFALVGLIQPPAGALLQELIDVAAILNALRTSRAPRERDALSVKQALAPQPA